ncbi:twin-arginine translocase TatA/TatE family subunit [Mycetocola miduiensis]|uniref:Sec-independent protein translocase protein TatA n=1 Tax=Mycetocola miduiensis TaxID=995034 RepID=A0A1I5A6V7_9MICO|nr:twin-arginine translocase TatA/TatE family subunit [Mycetocola miduiensis]SFN58090.1 sec-independent protein translocase protein TatA [Mycetocola miduiensis]
MGIFGNAFSGWHLLVIVFLVLLLFGAPKLPALAKSVGQSMKIFKSEIKSDKSEKDTDDVTAQPVPPTATQASADPTIVNPGTGTPESQTKP